MRLTSPIGDAVSDPDRGTRVPLRSGPPGGAPQSSPWLGNRLQNTCSPAVTIDRLTTLPRRMTGEAVSLGPIGTAELQDEGVVGPSGIASCRSGKSVPIPQLLLRWAKHRRRWSRLVGQNLPEKCMATDTQHRQKSLREKPCAEVSSLRCGKITCSQRWPTGSTAGVAVGACLWITRHRRPVRRRPNSRLSDCCQTRGNRRTDTRTRRLTPGGAAPAASTPWSWTRRPGTCRTTLRSKPVWRAIDDNLPRRFRSACNFMSSLPCEPEKAGLLGAATGVTSDTWSIEGDPSLSVEPHRWRFR